MTVRSSARRASAAASPRSIPQRSAGQPGTIEIPTSRISPNPHQPRKRFDADSLATLTASIAEHGVLQPILVTETIDGYQLVAGERRLRAAQAAGLDRIPAVVRQLADRDQLELALVENLQREDLDPIETADAYRQLIDEFGFSQDAVATRVGRARSTVANTLRLLDLAPAVQAARCRRSDHRGPRPRARRSRPRTARTACSTPSSARNSRSARPRSSSGGCANRSRAGRDRRSAPPIPTSSASRRTSAARSGPRSASPARGRGGRIVIEYYSDEELGRLYERLTGGHA